MASLVSRAEAQLRLVIEDPTTKLDAALFERVRRESLQTITKEERVALISLVVELLQTIEQDPSPATKLAEELVESYHFSDVLSIQPAVDLVAGLKIPSAPIQLLVLRLLSLASRHVGDVGIVAGNTELVTALINTWLRTPDIAVAESARSVLSSLLLSESGREQWAAAETAVAGSAEVLQQGLMRRRVFRDKNVYELLFSLPSTTTLARSGQLTKKDKTLAQGRLFDLLKETLHLQEIWTSQLPEVEQTYGLKAGQGLLHFAALHMIDKDDVLLRVTQIDFFSDSIQAIRGERERKIAGTQLLNFMTTTGVHSELVSIYTAPQTQDPVDITFHYGPAARYVATYAHVYHDQLMSDTAVRTKVFKRLHEVFDAVPNSQWARNDGPGHDLNVLTSLPRSALALDPALVLRLPTKPASADVFKTLARLFSGRVGNGSESNTLTFPPTKQDDAQAIHTAYLPWQHTEQWAARYLFLKYLDAHPTFWANVIEASSVAAFKDTAVAAIDLLHAIVRAEWQTEPGDQRSGVDLSGINMHADHRWYGTQPPANGVAAVIHPQVIDVLLPFVMKGPDGRGVALLGVDTESSAYHIHRAKLGLTQALEVGIQDAASRLRDDQMEKAMLSELAAGLSNLRRRGFSQQHEPGAEVGTMEL